MPRPGRPWGTCRLDQGNSVDGNGVGVWLRLGCLALGAGRGPCAPVLEWLAGDAMWMRIEFVRDL
jgi:hypothetical protein